MRVVAHSGEAAVIWPSDKSRVRLQLLQQKSFRPKLPDWFHFCLSRTLGMQFLTFRIASRSRRYPAGGGSESTDWRVICPCQHHRSADSSLQTRLPRKLKRHASMLLLAFSLCVGALALPTDVRHAYDSATVVAEVDELEALPFSVASFLSRELTLVDPSKLEVKLMSDTVREEFFRTEIPFGSLIYREAKRNQLPPELVAAVIKTESNFRASLVSHKNAIGLMQIIPPTGEFMGARDLFDPAENIRVGTRYLRYLNRKFRGDQTLVLAAYNAGEGNVRRYGGIPPFKETINYVRKVNVSKEDYSRRLSERLSRDDKASRFAAGDGELLERIRSDRSDPPKRNTVWSGNISPAGMLDDAASMQLLNLN